MGPAGRLRLVGHAAETSSADYHVMGMKVHVPESGGEGRVLVDDSGVPVPTYLIRDDGVRAFLEEGMNGPPRLVLELLRRHGVDPARVAMITHQASRGLLAHWADAVRPGQHLDTFQELGNMGLASVPVTLARRAHEITADYIVLVSRGPGPNA